MKQFNVLTQYLPSQLTPHCLLHAAYYLLLAVSFLASPGIASASVTFFDDVTTSNKTIQIKALTKGRFFPEGGKLVTFYVNDENIGVTLSGGDGYAFIKYRSSSPGVKEVKVEAGEDTDTGALLIVGKKDKVLVIDVDNTLIESIFSQKPAKGSRKVLGQLSKKYRIIYLTGIMGMRRSREWIEENELPVSTVLAWEDKHTISDLLERGVNIYAVIASPDVISELSEVERRYSFKATDEGVEVDDWEKLLEILK